MNKSEDEFEGFGDGFSGFPKRLPEDCVEYSLFVIDPTLKTQKELLTQLESIRKESVKLTDALLKEYIWQRDSLKLELENDKGDFYLHGVTNYGDSVADEWIIVYMLKELSNQFPSIWIKIVDADGEFLLIEAANALPRWLNPEVADNRVWIHQNNLRIIPRTVPSGSSESKATSDISRGLTLEEARKTISSTPEILIHSPLIEEEAFFRLRNYPSQISSLMHHSLITVPRKLAYMLHELPASIAPAVEAFYLRDPIALKLLQAPNSKLAFPPSDLVTVSTRFTRILFAQLKSQEFPTPRSWKDVLLQASETVTDSTPPARLEIGMKVTSGFEMLIKDPKNRDHRAVRELSIHLDDLATDASTNLPTDAEIASWKGVQRSDSETWLDINFEDFERELQGNQNKTTNPSPKIRPPKIIDPEELAGFGDAKTQADLRKMVERFEAFLNDDEAGVDGAEVDDMDIDDDDDDDDEDGDSEDEDKEVSFDENEFARMMREMMGMPAEEGNEATIPPSSRDKSSRVVEELDSDDEELDEAEEMRKVMDRMGAELKEAGALNLDPLPTKSSLLKAKGKDKDKANFTSGQKSQDFKGDEEDDEDEDEEDGDMDIDFNLAKNLLESFKSQAGMAGPGGNLMAMMGMQLPRDEGDVKRGVGNV